MRWKDLNRNPTDRTLRQFAGLCLLVFGGLAAWRFWRYGLTPGAIVLGLLAAALAIPGWIQPRWLRPVFVGALIATFPISWLSTQIIVLGMYLLAILPIALVFRLMGRDALDLRQGTERPSFWRPKSTPVDVRRYFRQY